jgi:hypothetical protein
MARFGIRTRALTALVLAAGATAVALAPEANATGTTTTSVSTSPNPSVIGQNVTINVRVEADVIPAPVGLVTIFDGLTPLGVAVLFPQFDGGICSCLPTAHSDASFSTTDLSAGSHTISAQFFGDPLGNGPSTGFTTHTVTKIPTTTTVTSAPNPSVYGQGVTLTANVATNPTGLHTIAGTVQFQVDGANVGGAIPVSGGSASLPVSNLNVGNHTVAAFFTSTDSALLDSNGTLAAGQVVNKADTITTLVSSANPSVFGQAVTLTATTTPVSPGGGTPTGNVTFKDGGTVLGISPISGGAATLVVSTLTVGAHSLSADYVGDASFNGSTGTLTQTVNKAPTTTSVSSSANPSVFGQPVSFTVTVCAASPSTSPPAPPTGSVSVTIDGAATPFATVTLSPVSSACAQATTPTIASLSVGPPTHSISATYTGDGNFVSSNGSLAGGQLVNKAPTTTTLTFTPPVPAINQAVTFTATVTHEFPNAIGPTGTVSFFIDGSATPLATVPLVGNTATFVTTFGGGNHTVVARYNGDGNYLASTSDAATPNVPCDRTITGTFSSLTLTTPGSVCVLGAHISGGISAGKGVVLDVENSTVSGSISTNGAAGARICGSSTGTIVIAKSTAFVLVGDPANNCPANTVAGSILATSNTNGLVIVGNKVSGTVTASGNSGAGPLAVYPAPIVSGNHH